MYLQNDKFIFGRRPSTGTLPGGGGALRRDADGGGWIPMEDVIKNNSFSDWDDRGKIVEGKEGDTIEDRQEVNFVG